MLAAATLLSVPFVEQRQDTCAAAALSMVMAYWQKPLGQDEIARELLQPELRGILGSRLQAFARGHGFRAIAYTGDLAQLREYLEKGRPLIVAWKVGRGRYHNVVVVGHDAERRVLLVNNPALGSAREVSERDFEKRWAGAGHWTLLVLPEAATPAPASSPAAPDQ